MKHILQISTILTLLSSCSTPPNYEEQEANQSITHTATEIQIQKAETKPFLYLISSKGKIIPKHTATIYTKISGILTSVLVSSGDKVKSGDLLATIENDQQKIDLEKASAALDVLLLKYKEEKIGYYKVEQENAPLDKEVDKKLKIRNGIPEAELRLKEAQLNLSYTTIRATQSGVVADLMLKKGNLISPDQVLCVIYKPDLLQVQTQILESEITKIRLGQDADIKTLTDNDKTYQATVSEINPLVNDNNGMVNLKLDLDKNTNLLPGMNVSAIIKIPYHDNIIISKDALVIRSGKQVVFVEENGLAKWKYVTVGKQNTHEIEITEGLSIGDKVIVSNNLQLAHDSPVKIVINDK